MPYANCHLVELSIKVLPGNLILATHRDDEECKFVDVTYSPRFDIVKKAKFCSYCDRKE